ncbi:FecR family protein [Arcicella rosea]|uniref:Ferric-dicitrate binding protein FerR (Iron transport regulator) n=1 Tax=Arcicella rosea TaxID=502909 RepID=A0A841EL50_9BACT|nr:FecR domain-containing protein [Arcicella rosea]MBB6002914.1 ferric-dicitrate binding protein FerR (iron transport regulator) [Arcicella rosea]
MRDYKHFSTIDFIADQDFINWVKYPTPENMTFWESWLSENPDKATMVAIAREVVNGWQHHTPNPSPEAISEVWGKIQHDISGNQHRPLIKLLNMPYIRYAAILVCALIATSVYFLIYSQFNTSQYSTLEGETRKVALPDGSLVVLNANSSIEFSKDWEKDQAREVFLKGEAYFSIIHQKNHQKFIVNTPEHLQVEVLGTVFTVSEKVNGTRVVLNSGKIKLHLNDKAQSSLLMHPGELVEVSKDLSNKVMKRKVVAEEYSEWKDSEFLFDNSSLEIVARTIENNFNYKVKFANDSLKERRITLRLPKKNLDLLLLAIGEMHDLKIEKHNNKILISNRQR